MLKVSQSNRDRFEDIDNEGLSDIPKVLRVPVVEIDDIAVTSPGNRRLSLERLGVLTKTLDST